MRNSIIFLTGGSRSGKSAAAQRLAEKRRGKLLYIATAEALDGEMEQRIDAHRRARGERWDTIEERLDLAGALRKSEGYGAVLVDCLTLWTSNLIFAHPEDPESIEARMSEFLAALGERLTDTILVTNEVGMGIVPGDELSRKFRDLAGTVNQRASIASDEAYLVVSGRFLKLS